MSRGSPGIIDYAVTTVYNGVKSPFPLNTDDRLSDARTPLAHKHKSDDITDLKDQNTRVSVSLNGAISVGARRQLNFISGSDGITLLVSDDPKNEKIDIRIDVPVTTFRLTTQNGKYLTTEGGMRLSRTFVPYP